MILKTQDVESLKGKDIIVLECEYCHKDFESTKAKYLRTLPEESPSTLVVG